MTIRGVWSTVTVLSALAAVAAAAAQECEAGGDGHGSCARQWVPRHTRPGHHAWTEANVAPVFGSLEDKLGEGVLLERWDGVKATAQDHLEWMKAHTKKYTDASARGFRHQGERSGIKYEIHDELTADGGGAGYFRLSGEVDIAPELCPGFS